MGVSAHEPADARHRDDPRGADDPLQPAQGRRAAGRRLSARLRGAGLALVAALTAVAHSAHADMVRLATYNVELTRRGPGLLLRDILSDDDPQIDAIAAIIARVAPDILLLTNFDYDLEGVALGAFADRLARAGIRYPHRFAARPNTGMATGRDMDGDGRRATPDDAQGYGAFAGQGGMALLSRLPVAQDSVRDFSGFLWADLPGARLPRVDGQPFPNAEVFAIQRLSTTGHWAVPVALPGGGRLTVLAFHASPPVFGGPHGRNRARNHDEVRFWTLLLDGALPMAPPDPPFVLMGDSNLDPLDGDGDHAAMRALLDHPALQDPRPRSDGGAAAASGPLNEGHAGDPALDTALWRQEAGPGNLRVDHVLPSAGLEVVDAGVFWPVPGTPAHALLGEGGVGASRHRLVWVDVRLPDG
ncbi:endonuclease [Rhodobacteraceae bacterium WD3A24]|nr:endonuclease [Rhodobacteraceae bacterium WD3A24]